MPISSLWVILSVLLPSGNEFLPHDLHLSRCEVHYDKKTSAIQISATVFIDDLELALEKRGFADLKLLTTEEHSDAEEAIAAYFDEKLVIIVDGKPRKALYLGKEMGDDIFAAWFYLEIPDLIPEMEIEVTYDLLMEIFDDQRNIVRLSFENKKPEYFLFDHQDKSGKLSIK